MVTIDFIVAGYVVTQSFWLIHVRSRCKEVACCRFDILPCDVKHSNTKQKTASTTPMNGLLILVMH